MVIRILKLTMGIIRLTYCNLMLFYVNSAIGNAPIRGTQPAPLGGQDTPSKLTDLSS